MKKINLTRDQAIEKAGQKNVDRLIETAAVCRSHAKGTSGLAYMLKDGFWYCLFSKNWMDGGFYQIQAKEINEDDTKVMTALIKYIEVETAVIAQEVVENIRVITSRYCI